VIKVVKVCATSLKVVGVNTSLRVVCVKAPRVVRGAGFVRTVGVIAAGGISDTSSLHRDKMNCISFSPSTDDVGRPRNVLAWRATL
jgi:hypothetical protein